MTSMMMLSQPLACAEDAVEAFFRGAQPEPTEPPPEFPHGYELTLDDRRALAGYMVDSAGVATIPLTGVISGGDGWGTSWQRFTRAILAAKADPGATGALLWIDSPGGVMGGVSAAVEAIRNFGKNIRAHIASMGGSGGYWAASAVGPGNISASPEAVIGAVGAVVFAYKGEDEFQVRFVSSRTPRKGAGPATSAGKEDRQRLVDEAGDLFLASVAKSRGIKGDLDAIANATGNGAMLSAKDALALGMIDEIKVMTPPGKYWGGGIYASAADPPGAIPGKDRGGNMSEGSNHNPVVAELEAKLLVVTGERDRMKAELDARRADHEALSARVDDERTQRAELKKQLDGLDSRVKASEEGRIKAEADAAKLRGERAVDLLVADGLPESRRESALKAFSQHESGDSAWWEDIKASFTPGAGSHLRGAETHGGKPPRLPAQSGGPTDDERIKAYCTEHKCAPSEAMAALGIR